MSRKLLYFLTAIALAGCASAGARGGSPRDYNFISENEITAQNGTNAYDVISHLRPQYLKTRGRTTILGEATTATEYAAVFMDGQYFGDLNSLRNIASINIREIRYFPTNEAVTRYGMQYGNGVIEIKTR